MKNETIDCDSCDNVIVLKALQRPDRFSFNIPGPDGAQTYRHEEKVLCTECQRKILDFIEDCPEDEVRVDPIGIEDLAMMLEQNAATLEELAEELQEKAENDV